MVTNACSVPMNEFTAPKLIMLVIIGTQSVVGAWINSFIVTVCCINRLRNKFLCAGDQILMVLATNRFCSVITGTLQVLCRTLTPTIYYKDFVYQGLRATLWFFISSSLWLVACLCLLYCLKIANFSHPVFISLKLNIPRPVPALLLGCGFLSWVNTIPFFAQIYMAHCDMINAMASRNITANQINMHTNRLRLLFLCGSGFSVGFAIFVISVVLLLIPLWRHAQQLRDVLSSHTSPGMAAQVQAVKIITYSLVTYLVNFVVLKFILTGKFSGDSNPAFLCVAVVNACPSVHSIVLILTNSKFKKAFLQALQHGGCKR